MSLEVNLDDNSDRDTSKETSMVASDASIESKSASSCPSQLPSILLDEAGTSEAEIMDTDSSTHKVACSVLPLSCESGGLPSEEQSDDRSRGEERSRFMDFVGSFDHESLVFSTRVATSMVLASLFTLLFSPQDPYPYAVWVVTSAGVVSWQDNLDTASALKKAIERTVGTIFGGAIGLIIGCIAFAEEEHPRTEALILGVLFAVASFAIPYLANRYGYRGSYAARLGLITCGIVALSSYGPQVDGEPTWMVGAWRGINIIVGCLISCFSLLLWPLSTKQLIITKVQQQMRMAGEAADTVLSNAHGSFLNKRLPIHWDVYMRPESSRGAVDEAYLAYSKGMSEWKSCNELFPNLKYDPFFRSSSKKERERFQEIMSIRSQRAYRIQINLVMIDSIVRGGVEFDGYKDTLDVFRDVGRRVKIMLDLDNEADVRELAVKELIDNDLIRVRCNVQRLRRELSRLGGSEAKLKEMTHVLTSFSSRPLEHLESGEQMVLFFELVEHLIIRASRLYYFCAFE